MISIFIPIYNGAKYLAKTLNSVLGQTYPDLEVLCVDDSSTDESLAILKAFAQKDSRVRVFSKPNEGSVPPSWDYVIPLLRGEFTLYMSQDDLLENDSIELMVAKQKETGADTVMTNEYLYFEDRGDDSKILIGVPDLMDKVIDGKDALRLMLDYQIPGFALWSTEIIKAVGVSTETFNADELAQRQWIARSKKVAFSRGVFLYRCDNPQAITKHHTPLHYESILTDAMLLLFVEKELVGENDLIRELANRYYKQLYKLMILFRQHRSQYSKPEKKRVKLFFQKAYQILRTRETLPNWKFRVSRWGYPFLQAVVLFKATQFSLRGVDIINDMDLKPIQTPRRYLQQQ